MNTNNSSDFIYLSRLVALLVFLRCGFELYHDVKLFGFNYSDIVNTVAVICILISFIIDLVYRKIGKCIPKIIVIIIIAIIISTYIVYLYLDTYKFGFKYNTIFGIVIPIYLAVWYITMLAYVKKGRDIPKIIKIIPSVILFSVIALLLILSSIDKY
jgi:hypothetical protein